MPPVRKNSKAAEDLAASKIKPMKTVRTHEENQERAYVAASRRSDRSLEARIESARRASEIHKKRTGRAFRITEEDVLNEQYYEEVDDDIPASIRRLQMHLNGLYHWNNPRFDSYMISNYAKHHAAWIAQRFGQQSNSQYANPPIFSNSFGQGMTPGANGMPPMTGQADQQQMPGQTVQQSGMHQRSASIAATPGSGFPPLAAPFSPTDSQSGEDQRRFSLPVQSSKSSSSSKITPALSRDNSGSSNGHSPTNAQGQQFNASPQQYFSSMAMDPPAMNTTCQPQQMMSGQGFDNMSPTSFSGFSPTMPMNVQQIWDGSNATPDMSYYGSQMGYQYNPNAGSTKSPNQSHPFNSGIHQTLTGNPLGHSGFNQSKLQNQSSTSPQGDNQQFDNFWGGDASQNASGMGSDFEGFFNFPAGSDDHSGDNFFDDCINVTDDVTTTD